MVRVAINGFGRIGRMILKKGLEDPEIDFVAINDLTEPKMLAYLFKYDSVHGSYPGTVEHTAHSIIINGKEIKIISEKDPTKLPWADLKIDIALECTGRFTNRKACQQHFDAGAKKVLVSAPCKCGPGEKPVKTIVKGVNEHILTEEDTVVSNASCTTNCLAPMVKVLQDNFGIEHGFMMTVHSYTGDQRLVDAPHSKDFRRARSAAVNIIPTSTGAATSVAEVIPELHGKLDGYSIRVPTADGSLNDFVAVLKKKVTVEEINNLFKNVSKNELKGILEYSEEPLVSSDIIGNPASCIFDASLTKVIDGNLVKIFGWYDNEWGYSCRMIDLIKLMK